ncbi:MAG: ATP-grasp domain-containing protein [Candidatus Dependentiae bacterium]|nr:ATP-grasp domain-containing protein [Candidatus Dependentiae bacterium]
MNSSFHLLKVGILMGGRSIEREVSFNSGRTICDHLDTSRYSVIPLFQTLSGQLYVLPWHFLHRGKIADFEHRLEAEARPVSWDDLKTLIDFCYIALHGRYGEDGCVQGIFELLQIPYLGSKVLASALGMDKSMQKVVLQAAGIQVPPGIVLQIDELNSAPKHVDHLAARLEAAGLSFPLIVKPAQEGSSLGVRKIAEVSELEEAVGHASRITGLRSQPVIIEQAISGLEFSCIVITDPQTGHFVPLPPTEVVIEANSAIFDYEQKYMPGRATKHTPARCTAAQCLQIQETSAKAMHALGFTNLGRIDGFLTSDGQIIITDPNSFSGMSPSSYAFLQAAEVNMTHTDLINHLIKTELHNYGMLETDAPTQPDDGHQTTTAQKRLRVGVLLGGATNEREISLESGRNVCYKLSPHKYVVTPLFVDGKQEIYAINPRLLVRNTTAEIGEALTPEMHIPWSRLPELFDFVFIGLHGGVGENGSVQGMLEMLGVPYNGPGVLASALCADKYKTDEFLQAAGLNVPIHHLILRERWKTDKSCPLPFPVIVKPHDDGCSVMVNRARTEEEFVDAVEAIFAGGKECALVEEMVVGTEITIGVIGNERPYALLPSQSIAARGILSIEEKFLPGAGENQTPALLPKPAIELIRREAERVFAAAGCRGYARIDCFYQDAVQSPTGAPRLVVLEVNTLPGLTPATCLFHQAAEVGIKTMDFIDLIVQLGLELHTQRPHLTIEQRLLFEVERV